MEKIAAEHIYIQTLFYEQNYLFQIPEFQRPFSWEEENFEKLVDDIKTSLEADKINYSHFT